MYGALWRVLPGPIWVRIILVLLLYSLSTWVFPWVETLINNQEATVGT